MHLFVGLYFCMNIMMAVVMKDNLIAYFGSTWSRRTNEPKLTRQMKVFVNQNSGIEEWHEDEFS